MSTQFLMKSINHLSLTAKITGKACEEHTLPVRDITSQDQTKTSLDELNELPCQNCK